MKIAFIADIHGNLEALEAVLESIRKKGIKNIICIGDIVGYSADPNKCCEIIRKMKIPCVMGNLDIVSATLEGIEKYDANIASAIRWTHSRLSEENRDWLSKLPNMNKIEIEEISILAVHGTIADPLNGSLPSSSSDELVTANLSKSKSNLLVAAHTHIPMVRKASFGQVINPGSVGQPRDNNPLASYAIFDTEMMKASIERVKYDVDKAARKTVISGLPGNFADRLYIGR